MPFSRSDTALCIHNSLKIILIHIQSPSVRDYFVFRSYSPIGHVNLMKSSLVHMQGLEY